MKKHYKLALSALALLLSGSAAIAQSGAALEFTGNNEYLDCGVTNMPTGNSDWTVEFAVNIPSSTSLTGQRWITWFGTNSSNQCAVIGYDADNGNLIRVHHLASGNDLSCVTAAIPFDTWTKVTIVYNGASKTNDIYINGSFVETLTFSVNLNLPQSSFQIGTFLGNSTYSIEGSLDEFRVWDKALCGGEINHYLNGEIDGSTSNLVAAYHFNQGTAASNNTSITTVTDATSNGNDGTLNNFSLTGSTSNFITPGSVTTGNAATAYTNNMEMNLTGNSNNITDGSNSPATSNSTDFGPLEKGAFIAKTFTIENTGTADLTVSNITLTGANAADYAISGISFPATITASGSTTFIVTCTPSGFSTRTATVHITNDDCDESDYDFAVSTCAPALLAAGSQNVSQNVSTNCFTASSCADLIATVVPSGGSPMSGTVTSTVTIDGTVQSYGGQAYVQRHYDIEPATNPSTTTATITLYYTQAEFDAYNADANTGLALPTNAADATGISHLRIAQYHGTGTAPGEYTGYTGPDAPNVLIDPLDADIVYNTTMARWEVTFDVTGFSGFYAYGGSSIILPIELSSFTASNAGKKNRIDWKSGVEPTQAVFEVQRSADGKSFSSIGSTNGKGNASSYTFYDEQPLAATNYYRLKVNGGAETVYSNIVTVSSRTQTGNVTVAPVPAANTVHINCADASLVGSSATIVNMKGQVMQEFTLAAQNNINIQSWPAGIYSVRLASGDVLRLVKD